MKFALTVVFVLSAFIFLTTPAQAQDYSKIVDPELEKLLILFDARNHYPANPAEAFYEWTKCFDPKVDRAPIKLAENGIHYLDAYCAPDTLYTWAPNVGLKEFNNGFNKTRWNSKFSRQIFTHINPVSTFAYGRNPIRIKLKPGIKFFLYLAPPKESSNEYCKNLLPNKQWKDTVIVRFEGTNPWISYTDYILCSPGPIESWSYGQKTHFDEIVTSTRWYFEQAEQYGWIPYYNAASNTPGLPPTLFDFRVDAKRNSDSDFKGEFAQDNLRKYLFLMKQTQGQIHYAPGIKPDEQRHFSTTRPIYWNTRRTPVAP